MTSYTPHVIITGSPLHGLALVAEVTVRTLADTDLPLTSGAQAALTTAGIAATVAALTEALGEHVAPLAEFDVRGRNQDRLVLFIDEVAGPVDAVALAARAAAILTRDGLVTVVVTAS